MKSKALLLFLGIVFPTLLFSQQIYQLSNGGTPWGYKFSQYDSEIPVIDMGIVDASALEAEDLQVDPLKDRPWRFGYNHYVNYNLNNSGVWKTLDNGDKIWRLGISCPGAVTVNIAFQYLSIPEGAKLFVYNEDKTITLGSFSQEHVSPDGELGTELLSGENIFVEYFVPASCPNNGSLEIFRITHGYRSAFDYARAFGSSGSCNMNVNCPDGAPWTDQKRSVVMLVSGGSGFCTGALINNTCEDATPYVLTANHCGAASGSWVFRFNWESATCANPGSSPSFQSISGGTPRASRVAADMNICQINSAVPAGYNAYWSGWNRGSANPPTAVGIHHPSGDIKKISFDDAPIATTTAMGGETNCCWDVEWDRNTTTEGGSSGSPLYDNNGRIIGQLWGGAALCTNLTGHDYYGRIFQNWNPAGSPNSGQMEFWLAPAGCGAVPMTLDGYDPNVPSLTFDAQVQSITSPNGTLCTGNHSPVIVLKNNGTTTLTSMTINYQIDGGAATPVAWSGSLASGASANFTMPNITIAAGAHTYTATIVTASLNGSNTDLNTANNALTSNYTGVSATGVSLPFTEGFELVTFPPTNWTNENPDNNVTYAQWIRTTTASGFGGSTASAKIDQYNPASSTSGQLDNLITPYLDLTTQATPMNLTFSVANCRYDAANYDSLIVWITTDCGASWTRLASYGNNSGANQLATAPDNTNAFTPTAGQWATKTISLNSYATSTSARIRFQLKSGWGNNTFVDDVNITGSPLAPPVASFTVSDNTVCVGQTVTYTNTSTGATTFNWTFPGGSPGTGSTSPINVSYGTPGTYTTTLTATNAFGTNSSTQTITVSANPTNTASNTGPYCPGNTIQLNATAGANDYDWTGPLSYAQANTQNPTIASATTGMSGVYTVTVTNVEGCSATATTTVTVNANPTPTATNTGPYCPGQTIQLNSPTGSATDDWTGPNSYVQNNMQNPTIAGATPAMDGIYTVTVTNVSNCSATATTTVVVVNASSATANNGGPYCVGEAIALSSLNGGTGYAWSGPASYSNATQNPSILSSTVAMSGIYSVTITFTGGCTSSATTTVTVNALPTVNLSAFGTVCSTYAPVILTGGTPAGGTYTGTGVSGGSFNPGTAGVGTHNVTYTYTDGNGCSDDAVAQIVVDPCVGIEDNDGSVISVYPNPTTQLVYITGLTEGLHDYAIITTLGQVIRTGKLNGDGSIDMGVMATGTYYLKIDARYWKIIKQ